MALIMPNPNKEENEQGTNILPLLRTSIKDSDNNWLKKLSEGTVFLVRRKGEKGNPFVGQFHLLQHLDICSRLLDNLNTKGDDDNGTEHWVESSLFSAQFELVEVITDGKRD